MGYNVQGTNLGSLLGNRDQFRRASTLFMARPHRLSGYGSYSQSVLAMKLGGSSPMVVPAPQQKASIRTADMIAKKLAITIKSLMP